MSVARMVYRHAVAAWMLACEYGTREEKAEAFWRASIAQRNYANSLRYQRGRD